MDHQVEAGHGGHKNSEYIYFTWKHPGAVYTQSRSYKIDFLRGESILAKEGFALSIRGQTVLRHISYGNSR